MASTNAADTDTEIGVEVGGNGKNVVSGAPELLKRFYRDMLMIRRFEEKAGQLYGMGLIGGFCHLYIGQEAVAVGIQHALSDVDSVITGYRDHGHMLVCGMEPGTGHGRTHRAGDGLFEGQGRLDAYVRP